MAPRSIGQWEKHLNVDKGYSLTQFTLRFNINASAWYWLLSAIALHEYHCSFSYLICNTLYWYNVYWLGKHDTSEYETCIEYTIERQFVLNSSFFNSMTDLCVHLDQITVNVNYCNLCVTHNEINSIYMQILNEYQWPQLNCKWKQQNKINSAKRGHLRSKHNKFWIVSQANVTILTRCAFDILHIHTHEAFE